MLINFPALLSRKRLAEEIEREKETERFASACGIRLSDGWHIERYHQETGEGM